MADALLARLKDQGGERFDAAGWHYLGTLAQRAAEHDATALRLLEDKLERSVAAFAERFDKARSSAAKLLATACAKHPQAASELQRLFNDSDFRGLRRRRAMLEARAQCRALTELVLQLEPAASVAATHEATRPGTPRSPSQELKTVRESRATWARLSVDRQLSQAMKLAPQNAGPINSHMLVLRSLAMMQDIAPDYLNRFVSYADTLLALEPAEKELPAKKKKAAPAKAAKAAKAPKK